MKNTATLEIPDNNNLFVSVISFLVIFTVFVLFTFVLRIITLGLYKVTINRKLLRKYIHFTSVLSGNK